MVTHIYSIYLSKLFPIFFIQGYEPLPKGPYDTYYPQTDRKNSNSVISSPWWSHSHMLWFFSVLRKRDLRMSGIIGFGGFVFWSCS